MKQELFKQLIEEQEDILKNLQSAEATVASDADLAEGETMDMEDMSHQGESQDMARFYSDVQEDNKQLIQLLERLSTHQSDKIEPGAVVVTDDMIFVIGIAVPNTTFDGKKVIGVSEGSRVYHSNENRTLSDGLLLGEHTKTIVAIH